MTYEVMLYDVTVSKMIDSCYGLDLHSQYGQSTALVPSQNRFWAIILSSCYIMISLLHLLFWLHHIYPNSIHNSLLHHTLCPCTDFGTVHSGGPGAKKSNLDCIVSRHPQVTWRHAHGLLLGASAVMTSASDTLTSLQVTANHVKAAWSCNSACLKALHPPYIVQTEKPDCK